MKLHLLTVAAIGALSLAGCGSDANAPGAGATGDATASDSASMPSMDAAMADATGSMTGDTVAPNAQGFVQQAAASDMFEIESSKLAKTMNKDAGVKDFAAMMVMDHTKSSAELKAAAGKSQPTVTVSPQLTAPQQADIAALKSAGGDFDAQYAQKQVAAHTKTLALLQAYSKGGDSPPLKALAAKMAPIVQGHLDKARTLTK